MGGYNEGTGKPSPLSDGNRMEDEMQEPEIWQAVVYYLIRLVEFSAVAAAGIAIGIKLRKRKNAKQEAAE